jgi:sugar phosphate isomerase/epimerase
MQIGAQFYTIRDFCKTPESLSESLKKIADIGYTTVQLSGTCPYDPKWMAQELSKNGLKCVITHTAPQKLTEETEQVCRDHDILDCRYVGLGSYRFDDAQCTVDSFLQTYLPVMDKLSGLGKYFMYHNHAMEFAKTEGKTILQQLAERTDSAKMGFTLDTYWVQVGGGDPAQWIERLSGRVPCIHLKDYSLGAKMAVVGEGNINFDRVFEMAEKAGTQYMLVEQDNCNGEDPFDCLRRSYEFLRSRGFR